MTEEPLFLLDACVFIQAFRLYYPFDIAPGFWNALLQHAQQGTICSIDRVKDELERGKDALAAWIDNYWSAFFQSTIQKDVLEAYSQIMTWAQSQTVYLDIAKRELADQRNADAWLAAYAMAKGSIVVTTEAFNPNVKKRIPVPNICSAFSVTCIDTFEMLRRLNVQF